MGVSYRFGATHGVRSLVGVVLACTALAVCGVAAATPVTQTAMHTAVQSVPRQPCAGPVPATASGYAASLAALPTSQWGGADLSVSVPMPDGRTVWLYGDTLSGPTPARWTRFVHSSAIVQDHNCLHVSEGGAQVLPDDSATRVSWLSSGIALDRTHLLVATAQIQLTGTCGFCFSQTGTRAAVLALSQNGDVTFSSWLPRWPAMTRTVVWGVGMSRSGTEVAMYGISPSGLTRDLYVATASLAAARNGQWTLGDIPVAHGVDPAGVTPYHDGTGWHLVTKRGDAILQLNATSPNGPFSERTLGQIHPAEPGHLYYMAAAHPELPVDGGKLLVTVCSAWIDGKTHPLAAYRPAYLDLPR